MHDGWHDLSVSRANLIQMSGAKSTRLLVMPNGGQRDELIQLLDKGSHRCIAFPEQFFRASKDFTDLKDS